MNLIEITNRIASSRPARKYINIIVKAIDNFFSSPFVYFNNIYPKTIMLNNDNQNFFFLFFRLKFY